MTESRLLDQRQLKVSYWDQEQRYFDVYKGQFETQLKKIADVTLSPLKSIDSLDAAQTDLLVIAAGNVPKEEFFTWFKGLRSRLARPDAIWVPVLFFADLSYPVLAEMFRQAVEDNWYFDVLSKDHIDSLPLRMANLLRIRDHLAELKRYGRSLDDLEQRVANLSAIVRGSHGR